MHTATSARRQFIFIVADMAHYHLLMQSKLLVQALHKYNPDQARVPAGNPDGGQWTSDGGVSSTVYQGEPDLPIDESYGTDALIGALGAGALAAGGRLGGLFGGIGAAEEGASILGKPDGIPDDWEAVSSDDGKGIKYVDPLDSRGGTYVRISPGNPDSQFPNSQEPYVRWQINGQTLDVNGNPVPIKSPDAHIPLTDFKFDPKVFE